MINLTDKMIRSIFAIEKSKCMYKLCKNTDTTYAYQIVLLQRLEKEGFIKTLKTGRIRTIDLTEKGKELKLYLFKIALLEFK